MCLRLNTSAGAMPASITVQRAALFAGAAMSKAHVTGRANTWSGATMINRRLLIYGAPKAATGGTLTVGNVGGFYGYSNQRASLFPDRLLMKGRNKTMFNRRLLCNGAGGVILPFPVK